MCKKQRYIKNVAILVLFITNLAILVKNEFSVLALLACLLTSTVLIWDVIDAIKYGKDNT